MNSKHAVKWMYRLQTSSVGLRSKKGAFFILLPLVSLFCLTSCAIFFTRLPNADEQKAIMKGEKSLVIIRLTAIKEGKSMDLALELGSGGYGLEIGLMDTGEILQPVFLLSPLSQTRKEGWGYFMLKPGSYFLYVIPPGSSQSPAAVSRDNTGRWYRLVDRKKIPVPAYWFHIPEGKRAVYLGSLSVSCKKGGLFGQLCKESSEIGISDETELARRVVSTYFTTLGTVWTEPLLTYDKSNIIQLLDKSGKIGVLVSEINEMTTPEWRKRALGRTLGWGAPMLAFEGGYPPGAVTTFYLFFYVPPAVLVGTIKGAMDSSKWEPCCQALAGEIINNDPSSILRRILVEQLLRYEISNVVEIADIDSAVLNTSSQSGFNYLLYARIMRLQLTECSKKGLFSIDAAIHFQVRKTKNGDVLLDRTLLYAGNYSSRPYELRMSGSSPCRKMEEYCGEQGVAVLRSELENAVRLAVHDLFSNSYSDMFPESAK